jgi:hypothetical protein
MTEKGLNEDAMARAFSTLRLFKRFCEGRGVDMVLPTTTAAVREAPSDPAFTAPDPDGRRIRGGRAVGNRAQRGAIG